MSREDAATKGRRYVSEGRLIVDHVNGDTITASCRGAGRTYLLGHDPKTGFWCDCDARTACSHARALQLVVAVRRSR